MTEPTPAPPQERFHNQKVWLVDPAPLKLDPLTEICPPMTDEEYADLLASVQADGVLTPLVVRNDDTRVVLDGRHRLRAALEAGQKEVSTVLYQGLDPIGFVIASNVTRRHLNTSQRAMVAAKLATMAQGARIDLASKDAKSQSDAAALLKVSRRSVQRAKDVLDSAPPEVVKAVEAGRITVGAATKRLLKKKKKAPVVVKTALTPNGSNVYRFIMKSLPALKKALDVLNVVADVQNTEIRQGRNPLKVINVNVVLFTNYVRGLTHRGQEIISSVTTSDEAEDAAIDVIAADRAAAKVSS